MSHLKLAYLVETIEKQYQKIINLFPNAKTVENSIYHVQIPLTETVLLDINFKKYPKRPKVILLNEEGNKFKDIDAHIEKLKKWKKKTAPSISELIKEILGFVASLKSNTIIIKKELIKGILALCRNQHPREILGLLRVKNGVVSEFILPPGATTSNTSGIFFPSRIPLDSTIQGTIHSHPSGNPYPSTTDLNNVFKNKRINIIVAYPYSNLSCIKGFDRTGKEIPVEVKKSETIQ
ncbi:MAG: hypothetical protein GF353_19315 [Candidatus Lokiarchaeota archaeon]|nr:hypothetical protein [Candidatus Lokiarchaeota archaeon]